MAKRKPAVNCIIYELDNDDSEISSDDEVKQPKIIRLEANVSPNTTQSDSNTIGSGVEVIDIDSSVDRVDELHSPKLLHNGGKSPDSFIIIDEVSDTASPKPSVDTDRGKKLSSDTIFNEDIVIDSPASNSDPGVVGCENRTPLVTVRFRDSKLAMNYKKKIKAFMLNLIKLHENDPESDNDTDLELDIWPEDLAEVVFVHELEKQADNLFFIDTDPCQYIKPMEVPSYSQNASMLSNVSEKEVTPPRAFRKKGPTCFNCNGSHTMRECTLPRNIAKIAENRKAMVKLGRYHVEDEQKYGHLVPGRISGQLRHALGLKRHELPVHVYRMRQLGYPPGWLEEARISHSGITLFDSSGQATLDPDEEEGEVWEPGSKDKFDIKKILDIPGFNVPASSRYKEEAHKLGLPPLSDQDSKMAMLQVLAPNAMKAYKRKKLTFFPSAPGQAPMAGQAEMDIDSGDEFIDFPSQPPLPDDAPPPPPPPPDMPPPPDSPPPLPPTEEPKKITPNTVSKEDKLSKDSKKLKRKTSDNSKEKTVSKPKEGKKTKQKTDSDDDIEVVEVLEVADIPIPYADMITIDVDGEVSEPETGYASPSLDDLEQKKLLLLNALNTEEEPSQSTADVEPESKDKENEAVNIENNKDDNSVDVNNIEPVDVNTEEEIEQITQTTDEQSEMKVVDDKVDSSDDKVEVVSLDNIDKVKPNSLDDTDNVEIISIDNTDKIELILLDESHKNEPGPLDNTDKVELITCDDSDKVELISIADSHKVEPGSLNDTDKVEPSSLDQSNTGKPRSLDDTDKGKPSPNDTPKVEPSSFNTPNKETITTVSDNLTTPTSSMDHVRGTTYGTPVMNIASPYLKLPSDDKFAKDICDIINFENLPNSTGKYKKISTLLKKVKSEVDRIQES